MKNRMVMFLIIVIVISFFGTACGKQTEHVYIPVPDESQVEIDPVTLEQIEERAKELEKKYCGPIYVWTYEEIYTLLIAANYEYLTEDAWKQWLEERDKYSDWSGSSTEYVSDARATWDYIYGVNTRGGGDSYCNCPKLVELFFDNDLIAHAEFVDRQIYNYTYQQDEHAMYNLCSYALSQEHPMTTEYGVFHYDGEVMDGGAGYIINSVVYRFTTRTICRYEDIDGYSGGDNIDCYSAPNVAVLFYRES